jgi:RNA ligase
VNYGDMDDLVLLGAVDVESGEFLPHNPHDKWNGVLWQWTGPVASSFGEMTFGDALAMPPREGAEGIVVQRPDTGDMVKVKQNDYIALHRILTNITARTLWEHLAVNDVGNSSGDLGDVRKIASRLHMDPVRVQQILDVGPDWMSDYVADALPDEFHGWVREVISDLLDRKVRLDRSFRKQFEQLHKVSPTRKDFAELVKDRRDKGILFALYQGQDIGPSIWSLIYPAADKPFEQSEEVA